MAKLLEFNSVPNDDMKSMTYGVDPNAVSLVTQFEMPDGEEVKSVACLRFHDGNEVWIQDPKKDALKRVNEGRS